ncbi:MAG: hypothetical protein EOP49_00910 [Sphingobacteriales bacterium]|nr:MAG: hypothetical protein EOP49_00910 [Sphingobacteriales bacterium]
MLVMGMYSFRPSAPDERQMVYEFKQFSTVESVIPGGMGRSRILTTDDRGQLLEKDLKNFYSLVGINFGNIANNDRAIVERMNQYSEDGWELIQVSTGSHAQASEGSTGGGLFITRYLFKRQKRTQE